MDYEGAYDGCDKQSWFGRTFRPSESCRNLKMLDETYRECEKDKEQFLKIFRSSSNSTATNDATFLDFSKQPDIYG